MKRYYSFDYSSESGKFADRDQSRYPISCAAPGEHTGSKPDTFHLLGESLDYAIKHRSGPDRWHPRVDSNPAPAAKRPKTSVASAAPRAPLSQPAPRAPTLSLELEDPAVFFQKVFGNGASDPASKTAYIRAAVTPEPDEGPYRCERSYGCQLHGLRAKHSTSECNALRAVRDTFEKKLGVHQLSAGKGYSVRRVSQPSSPPPPSSHDSGRQRILY